MPSVYFHAGAPKTGTSYLQVLFARYCEEMERQGVVYPDNIFVRGAKEGKITSGNGVELANYINPGLPHKIEDKSAFLASFDQLLKDYYGADLLFSSEFIVFQKNERTAALLECLAKNGYQGKVVYLVRDLANAAISTYSQQVKRAGEARTFEKFLASWDPHYVHHIDLMNAAFGRENVLVFNYEEHKYRLAALMFNDVLNIRIDAPANELINRSLNKNELELLRVFNGFLGGEDAFSSTLISDALMTVGSTSSERPAISRSESSILLKKFCKAIDKINDQITGRKIIIAPDIGELSENAVLTDFERFTMAALAGILKATRR